MKNKTVPNFLIVGAAKAGTTSIAKYLDAHPQVFMSKIKEPRYFVYDILKNMSKEDPLYEHIMENSVLNWSEYLDLFKNVDLHVSKIGEASVHYLYHYDTVIPKIKEKLGDIPIIIILRNPVNRAYSNYTYLTSVDYLSFEQSLKKEEERKRNNFNSFWYHRDLGNYFNQVNAYVNSFTNVHICLYDDLQTKPEKLMKNIYSFLNIDDTFTSNYSERYNETVTKNKLFYFIHKYNLKVNFFPVKLKKIIKQYLLIQKKVAISFEMENSLKKYYKEDIKKVEKLIKKDISHWYKNNV